MQHAFSYNFSPWHTKKLKGKTTAKGKKPINLKIK
jgi:hypothetical protein